MDGVVQLEPSVVLGRTRWRPGVCSWTRTPLVRCGVDHLSVVLGADGTLVVRRELLTLSWIEGQGKALSRTGRLHLDRDPQVQRGRVVKREGLAADVRPTAALGRWSGVQFGRGRAETR